MDGRVLLLMLHEVVIEGAAVGLDRLANHVLPAASGLYVDLLHDLDFPPGMRPRLVQPTVQTGRPQVGVARSRAFQARE